ncbi:MAG: hypothetical protein KC643_32775 [Nitrospira sp.]|nr:hypothetical protein [Nitrospira sp.]
MKKIFLPFFTAIAFGTIQGLAAPLNTNLILNGDAENGIGASDDQSIVSIPNWSTFGSFTVVAYSAGNGFPINASPGPNDRGLNFFAGGPNNTNSSAQQTIDVSSNASNIDLGRISFNLSGFFGGFSTQDDHAILQTSFLDPTNSILASTALGPVTPTDRADNTGLLPLTRSGFLPVGTRAIEVSLLMSRFDGIYNDGYADNLSLILHNSAPVPEPSTIWLCIAGFLLIGLFRGKRGHFKLTRQP